VPAGAPTGRLIGRLRPAQKVEWPSDLPAERADGNDVLAVYEVSRRAVERARAGEGVTLIELVTYRRKGHAEHDNQSYVPKDELARWERDDPLDRYLARLREERWAQDADVAAVDQRVRAELDAAVAEAEGEPLPGPETALEGVYAVPGVQPAAWYKGAPPA
jgi:pyruvate dehydrogenase E1 component alpha subunit/2-oxoisovalerate dehydrogenase E1 component alpha subunit